MNNVKNFELTNKYTGEKLPYKTISNVSIDPGIVNDLPDTCKLEDFEPIGRVVARFMRTANLDEVVNSEYAYNANNLPDLSEDSAFDVVDNSEDLLDNQIDLEDYLSSQSNDSATSGARYQEPVNEERSQKSDEANGSPVASQDVKPSEDDL